MSSQHCRRKVFTSLAIPYMNGVAELYFRISRRERLWINPSDNIIEFCKDFLLEDEEDNGMHLFCTHKNKIIGSLLAVPILPDCDKWYVTVIMVDPEFRRTGIARKLMHTLLYASLSDEVKAVSMRIHNKNKRCARLMRSLGAKRVDRDIPFSTYEIPLNNEGS